jgi:hypothetical protein
MPTHPFALALDAPLAATEPIAAHKLIQGTPKAGTLSAFTNDEQGFHVGQWTSERGSWRVDYSEDELCVILEGSGRLIGDDGSELPFQKGSAFVIPRGFKGVWETFESVRKIYAIAE